MVPINGVPGQSGTETEAREHQILGEEVKQLYGLAPIGFLATFVNSVLVFVIMRSVTPPPVLSLWLGTVLGMTLLRFGLVAWFRRSFNDADSAPTWLRRFLATLVVAGMAWGSIGLFPFSFSLAHQVFLAFVLGGMAAGASSTFSKVKWGYLAFAVPALLPLTVHFWIAGGAFHLAMASMTLLFLVLLWKISQHNYTVNRTSLLLRFENREMIAALRVTNAEVEALNAQLLKEIEAKEEAEAELRAHHDRLEKTVQEKTADLVAANEKLRSEIEERKLVEAVLKEAQEKLTLARDAAEAASIAKSEFLANMTHEMRTPLAGAVGMINLVLDMEIGDEERQLLQMAKRSAESLLRIISDVLDFSKVEAGVMKFEHRRFILFEAVRSAIEVVHHSVHEKGLALDWQVKAELKEMVGDEGRLRQVLVNLLGNAVKFTETGGIYLSVSDYHGDDVAGENFILFCVRDTGVGIPFEKLETIFGKFTQIDSSLTRKYGGTGLGLALSRQILEKMGGRIWVESRPGAGSSFYFTVPADSRTVREPGTPAEV